jgi:hypothetical protein
MLEAIGFLVWIVITTGLTAAPFFILAISALGGGAKRTEVAICILFIGLAAYSWYKIFSSITITIS